MQPDLQRLGGMMQYADVRELSTLARGARDPKVKQAAQQELNLRSSMTSAFTPSGEQVPRTRPSSMSRPVDRFDPDNTLSPLGPNGERFKSARATPVNALRNRRAPEGEESEEGSFSTKDVLLRGGLAMMAAGGQPGATFASALGDAGLDVLAQEDRSIERARKRRAAEAANAPLETLTAEQEAEMGLDPSGVYQRGPNGEISQVSQPSKPDAPAIWREYQLAVEQDGFEGSFIDYKNMGQNSNALQQVITGEDGVVYGITKGGGVRDLGIRQSPKGDMTQSQRASAIISAINAATHKVTNPDFTENEVVDYGLAQQILDQAGIDASISDIKKARPSAPQATPPASEDVPAASGERQPPEQFPDARWSDRDGRWYVQDGQGQWRPVIEATF